MDVERVFREEYGRAVAVLVRVFGDIDAAEEAVQDAFTEAVRRWPETGLPPSPAGWIITTARNRGIDRFRRESSREERQREAAEREKEREDLAWCEEKAVALEAMTAGEREAVLAEAAMELADEELHAMRRERRAKRS